MPTKKIITLSEQLSQPFMGHMVAKIGGGYEVVWERAVINPYSFSEDTLEEVFKGLDHEDNLARQAAANELRKRGVGILPEIVKGLADETLPMRVTNGLVIALWDMASSASSAVPALLDLFASIQVDKSKLSPLDPYYSIRENIIVALGKIGDKRALPLLTQALTDVNPMVNYWAHHYLTQLTQ